MRQRWAAGPWPTVRTCPRHGGCEERLETQRRLRGQIWERLEPTKYTPGPADLLFGQQADSLLTAPPNAAPRSHSLPSVSSGRNFPDT